MAAHREPSVRRSCARSAGSATQTIAGTGADDDPSSNCRPAASSSRSLSSAIPAVAARSATALRERPQTGVPFAWSPAARNQAGTTECDAGRELQPSSAGVQKENETHLCQAASAHDAPTLWSSISA